jgi:hypothetical protein
MYPQKGTPLTDIKDMLPRELAVGLMRDDPARFKVGYTAENAVKAVTEAKGLTPVEERELRRWLARMHDPKTERFLADVIVGAVEGGTGYWACVSSYRHEGELADTRAVLHEMVDDADETTPVIEGSRGGRYAEAGMMLDLDAVRVGIARLDELDVPYEALQALVIERNAGNLDADDCDTLAQLALLGEVRYG